MHCFFLFNISRHCGISSLSIHWEKVQLTGGGDSETQLSRLLIGIPIDVPQWSRHFRKLLRLCQFLTYFARKYLGKPSSLFGLFASPRSYRGRLYSPWNHTSCSEVCVHDHECRFRLIYSLYSWTKSCSRIFEISLPIFVLFVRNNDLFNRNESKHNKTTQNPHEVSVVSFISVAVIIGIRIMGIHSLKRWAQNGAVVFILFEPKPGQKLFAKRCKILIRKFREL